MNIMKNSKKLFVGFAILLLSIVILLWHINTRETQKELKKQEQKITTEVSKMENEVKEIVIDENFVPDWFNDSKNKFRGKQEGYGFPVYTNERLCFQITLPEYAKDYEAIVHEKATNLIHFRQKGTKPNEYGYYGRWFSIGRMSNEEYKYFSEIEMRGAFADSDVIGKSDEYIYLLQDIFVSQPPKAEKITAEELKFKIINCK